MASIPQGGGELIRVTVYSPADKQWVPLESSVEPLTLRMETVGNLTYLGTAPPGSSEADPVWQVKRLDKSSGMVILFADGNDRFDNVWANRAGLSYS